MIRDTWSEQAAHRLRQHLMRAVVRNGVNYAPDQTLDLCKAGQVGPQSAAIAKILQQHVDLWADDARTAAAAGIDHDLDAAWRACIAEADAAVGRYMAGMKAGRAA